MQSWQLSQLQNLASIDPDRVEGILNALWAQNPGLFKELAISAVDKGTLSTEDAAAVLRQPEDAVVKDLIEFRNRPKCDEYAVVHDNLRKTACVADGCVAVWEIVREYRKLGSMEELESAFPSLAQNDLLIALRYAESHSEEIESNIGDYERVLDRIRVEYPFMKETKA